ncbi:MAG: hypothetical protein AABZ67_00425 [Pseudomonadota bacterium]
MIDLLGAAFSAYLLLGQPNDGVPSSRAKFDTSAECAAALARDAKKFSLDPARFECVQNGETWIIKGKLK